jgi:fructose 1,6-bisphosphatase
MNILTDDNCIVDVTRLDDPEEQKKLQYLFKLQSYKKNIILEDEFNEKYRRLFTKDQNISVEDLQDISTEYIGRIDPYNPVYIVRSTSYSTVEELLDPKNVVMTLPAIWNKIGVINNVGEDAMNVLQAFNNIAAQGMDDVGDRKKKAYSESVCMAIQLMSDDNKLDMNKQKAQEMAKNVVTPKVEEKVEDHNDYLSDDIIQKYQNTDVETHNDKPIEHEEFL